MRAIFALSVYWILQLKVWTVSDRRREEGLRMLVSALALKLVEASSGQS